MSKNTIIILIVVLLALGGAVLYSKSKGCAMGQKSETATEAVTPNETAAPEGEATATANAEAPAAEAPAAAPAAAPAH